MIDKQQKLGILATCLTLNYGIVNTEEAYGATFYDFNVAIDSGPLIDETFDGYFSYTDSTVTGFGEEYIALDEFEFEFSGAKYSLESHGDLGGEVVFFDGDFLGLNLVSDTFAFNPGFFALDESFFSYNLGDLEGEGNLSYSLRQSDFGGGDDSNPKPVPEPSTTLGILTLAGLGMSAVWRK
jgi:hypothetical protein